jgi:hypothetical protein
MGMNVEMHSEVISDIQLTIFFLNLLLILAQARIILWVLPPSLPAFIFLKH